MITIEILGTGCKKCQQLEVNARTAAKTLGQAVDVSHITDVVTIATRGVMSTPALAINGMIVSTGKVLTAAEVETFLQGVA